MRSRAYGRGIGANDFAAAARTTSTAITCPPGYHDDGTGPGPIAGLGACVPNAAATLPPAATATAAAPCPAPWPLWWLLVAAGMGAAAGYAAERNRKAVRRNAGRLARHAGHRIVRNAERGAARARPLLAAMSPAEAKRQRKALMRDVARDLKSQSRSKLLALRERLRAARKARRTAAAHALGACRAARAPLPTVKQLAAELRAAKADAKSVCDVERGHARALAGKVHQARAELAAERKYRRELRRIESGNNRKAKARPGLARARQSESDDEVRGNIPPELVALFERVKRSIKGSDRKSRTEEFLEYADAHPDEEWGALEDAVDREIREMERRQAMPNPKKRSKKKSPKRRRNSEVSIDTPKPRRRKKKKAAPPPATIVVKTNKGKRRKNPPTLTAAQSRKRFAALKKAGCQPKRVRMGGQSVVVRRKACKAPPMRNPRRKKVEGRWFDRVLASPLGKKHARDSMRATPNADWYRQAPAVRHRQVKKLARGTPRQKRAAIAIAKAEQARAEGPRRNPGMSDRAASAEYERTHWGERGRGGIVRRGAPDSRHGTATKLGKLVCVVYETKKGGDDGPTEYVHDFEGKRPDLVYNDGGLMIAGGSYVVAEGGIDG